MQLHTEIRKLSRFVNNSQISRTMRATIARNARTMRTYAPRHEVKAYTWASICAMVHYNMVLNPEDIRVQQTEPTEPTELDVSDETLDAYLPRDPEADDTDDLPDGW